MAQQEFIKSLVGENHLRVDHTEIVLDACRFAGITFDEPTAQDQ